MTPSREFIRPFELPEDLSISKSPSDTRNIGSIDTHNSHSTPHHNGRHYCCQAHHGRTFPESIEHLEPQSPGLRSMNSCWLTADNRCCDATWSSTLASLLVSSPRSPLLVRSWNCAAPLRSFMGHPRDMHRCARYPAFTHPSDQYPNFLAGLGFAMANVYWYANTGIDSPDASRKHARTNRMSGTASTCLARTLAMPITPSWSSRRPRLVARSSK